MAMHDLKGKITLKNTLIFTVVFGVATYFVLEQPELLSSCFNDALSDTKDLGSSLNAHAEPIYSSLWFQIPASVGGLYTIGKKLKKTVTDETKEKKENKKEKKI